MLAIFGGIKKYNNEIALVLFCAGLFFYSVGLGRVEILRVQSLFHIGALLFISLNYKLFTRGDCKALAIPIACFMTLIVLGLLSYFDGTMGFGFVRILKEVNSHIIGYLALFLIGYLFARHSKDGVARFLLGFFIFLCVMNVVATLYLGMKNGLISYENAPFFHNSVARMALWICFCTALSVAGFLFSRGYGKVLFFFCVLLCLLATLCNAERAYIIAFVAMMITPLLVLKYRHKALIILASMLVCLILASCFYHYSKNLSPRYNIAHMIDNLHIVLDTPPIEMGKYDVNCFNNVLDCSKQSTQDGRSDLVWEHSSLSRIAMYKSALHIISQSPFTPRVIGMWNTGSYLYQHYSYDDPYRIYIDTYIRDKSPIFYGYQHIHSLPLSFSLEFGVLGLVAYMVLCAYIIVCGARLLQDGRLFYRIVGLSIIIALVGLVASTIFDIVVVDNLRNMVFVFGFLVGLCWKRLTSCGGEK